MANPNNKAARPDTNAITSEGINERAQVLLKTLVERYISDGQPVGSKALAENAQLDLSPATIRNVVADLERLGLVHAPHTSAGRVPTDEGYRTYVDKLIEHQVVPQKLAEQLREQVAARHKHTVDDILEQTAHVLATVTSQIGVTLAPRFDEGIISRIELVPVAERRMMVVLGIHSGLARTVLLEVASNIAEGAMKETEAVLNERLVGQSLGTLQATLADRLKGADRADARLIRLFVDAAEDLVEGPPGEALHVDGTSNLFSQPEFADHEAMGGVLRVIEKRIPIIELLQKRGVGEGLIVTIGQEVKLEGAEGCSLVSSNYQVGRVQGTIGILGPTRMEYAKVVAIVDYVAKFLSEQMEG